MINKIHEELRKERERQAITQEELAEKLHTSRENVSRMESGKNSPGLDTLITYVVGLTGKEPEIYIPHKNQSPFRQFYSYFEIKEIRTLSFERSQIEINNPKINLNKTAKDIQARIDFWQIVLESGAIVEPCNGIEVQIRIDKKQVDDKTLRDFVDCVTSGMFVREVTMDKRFKAETEWSMTALVTAYQMNTITGVLKLLFNNKIQNTTKAIETIISIEKDRLHEAQTFINENPDGFTFICYDWPLNYNEYDEGPLHAKLIRAWTVEEAKKKYLMLEKNQRLYDFFQYDFSDRFAESVLFDDYLFENNSFNNAEDIKKIAEEVIESLIPETKSNNNDSEEQIFEIIRNKKTKEELLEVFGMESFEQFWFDYSIVGVSAQLSEDQAQILEYVYSALAYDPE